MSNPVRMLTRARKPLIVTAATLATVTFAATSAQAATGSYEGAYAEVYPYSVAICDTQTDGNGAFVTVQRSDGVQQNFWDGTGHDQECGVYNTTIENVRFKVCEHHTGCTGWRDV